MAAVPDWSSLPSLLSIQQVAEIFQVHPNTLRKWDEQGKLRAIRLNGRGDFRYPKERVEKLFRFAADAGSPIPKNGRGEVVRFLRQRFTDLAGRQISAQRLSRRQYALELLKVLGQDIQHVIFPTAVAVSPSGQTVRVRRGLPPIVALSFIALFVLVVLNAIPFIRAVPELAVATRSGGRVLGASTEVSSEIPWLGYLTAFTSLFFGFIFFLYAIRSYFQIIFVLLSSRPWRNGNGSNGPSTGLGTGQNGNGNSIFRKWFQFGGNGHPNGNGFLRRLNGHNGPSTGLGASQNGYSGYRNGHNGRNGKNGPSTGLGTGPAGMWQDVTAIDLSHQPFISVHLPFYNERKVANRILTAATAFDYRNYEVIVVDDSTDETKAILAPWARHPKVKIIHRASREGFKGGALKVALQNTDPKAEFIVVFDADFIPYPDTLTHFVRYFRAASANGNGNGHTRALGASHNGHLDLSASPVAAVQGYQWHVLNRNENWITRAVRVEYSGSYVVERPSGELLSSLKQIAGSVFMVRRDLLDRFGWGTSITEDFELTLKLYADGFKVIYTPYIQAPAECVSSLSRLIRQRMRWAEGHTHNIRKSFWKVLLSRSLTGREKNEFLYLAPYYLQAAFFLLGTTAWLVSDLILNVRLPFWTALWGWSLVFTNLLALPLVNSVGLFLEESERKDYFGIASFILLTYILVPFQAYAAVKGLIKPKEGPWFRTPKTGHITDPFVRATFRKWFRAVLPGKKPFGGTHGKPVPKPARSYLGLTSANNRFQEFRIERRPVRGLVQGVIAGLLILTITLSIFARHVPEVLAAPDNYYFWDSTTDEDSVSLLTLYCPTCSSMRPSTQSGTNVDQFMSFSLEDYVYYSRLLPTGSNDATIASGAWNLELYVSIAGVSGTVNWTANAGICKDGADAGTTACDAVGEMTVLATQSLTNVNLTAGQKTITLNASVAAQSCSASAKCRIWARTIVTSATNDNTGFSYGISGSSANYITNLALPTVTVPENIWFILAIIPFLPWLVRKKILKIERLVPPVTTA